MEEKTYLSPVIKTMLIFTIILLIGILFIVVGNPFKKALAPILSPLINAIEISPDGKSILNFETKGIVLAIEGAIAYLETSGYAYNPDIFQITNAKYAGDCFLSAALSNNKDRIAFSTGCLAGDLPQAWVGIYSFDDKSADNTKCGFNSGAHNFSFIPKVSACANSLVKFLIGGSGRDFVWSADDNTITYEADLGLSGMAETRTIDSATGEILERKNAPIINIDK